jgi:hypothetical protein
VPQEVAGRLERIQEPDETRVGPARAPGRVGGAWRKDGGMGTRYSDQPLLMGKCTCAVCGV